MTIFYIIDVFFLIVFLFSVWYVELFIVKNMKKENQILKDALVEKQKKIDYLTKAYEDADKELYKKRMEYEEELQNFRKILKLQGRRMDWNGDSHYIPYYLNESKNVSRDFVELREEYIIPEIRICFGECWDGELYEHFKEREENYEE